MTTIDSIVYQRPLSLIQKYEFTLTYTTEEDTHVLPAIVTLSHEDGKTTIEGIAIEDMPEEIMEAWNPEWALKQIMFELGEELNKFNKEETFS